MINERRFVELKTWSRREYFEHYHAMDNPYFGLTVETDVTRLHERAKRTADWFYIRYLHAILRAVNDIEQFRYRIDAEGRIVLFDRIHVSPTVPREDGTFGFGRFEYDPDYEAFKAGARAETERVRAGKGLMKNADPDRIDTVYSTALPWVRFTDLTHPRPHGDGNGIVSLATGQVYEKNGRLLMSLQFQAHHGFADGRHAGLLIARIQRYFDE